MYRELKQRGYRGDEEIIRKKVYDQQFIPLNFLSKDEKIFSMKSENKNKNKVTFTYLDALKVYVCCVWIFDMF